MCVPLLWSGRVCSDAPDNDGVACTTPRRAREGAVAPGQVGRWAGGQDVAAAGARRGRGPVRLVCALGWKLRGQLSARQLYSLPEFGFCFDSLLQDFPHVIRRAGCVWSGRSHPLVGSGTHSPSVTGPAGKRKGKGILSSSE